VLAFKITPTTTNILEHAFNSNNPTIFLAGFLINLAVIMLVLRMASAGITGLFEIAFLGLFNRAAGGILTGGFGVLIYSVLLWFLVKVQFFKYRNTHRIKDLSFFSILTFYCQKCGHSFQTGGRRRVGLISRLDEPN
jgi:hypothetical protein